MLIGALLVLIFERDRRDTKSTASALELQVAAIKEMIGSICELRTALTNHDERVDGVIKTITEIGVRLERVEKSISRRKGD
jgi:septal ring factor EnvC (AmiA/AmiB activator)